METLLEKTHIARFGPTEPSRDKESEKRKQQEITYNATMLDENL